MSTWPVVRSSRGVRARDARIGAMRPGSARRRSLALAVILALAAAGCSGGAGLDLPIGPVDHSCPVENSCGKYR